MKLTLVWFLSIILLLSGCESNPLKPDDNASATESTAVSTSDSTESSNSDADASPTPSKEDRGIMPQQSMGTDKPTIGTDKPKIALVIGNSNYEYKSLENPINDAKDVSNTLKDIGFNVDFQKNLNKRSMDEAITTFVKRLTRQPGSVAFFYYAGHGVRVEGQNYLIPVDNGKIASETDVKYAAVDAHRILENMRASDTHLNIMVLDACRDNPYRSLTRGGLSRGLVPMQQEGSIIAFAAKEGQTALDISNNSRNGLYTSHLVKKLKQAHQQKMRIDDMFTEVRNAVSQESRGAQEPWSYVSWTGPYCFGGCESPVATPAPTVSVDNTRPSGTISGINPNYQVGETVKYNVTGTDNKALKTLTFKVANSSQEETWEVDGQTAIKKSSSFSTAGWAAGNYKYSLTVTDNAGNSVEETGNFALKASTPIIPPTIPAPSIPLPTLPPVPVLPAAPPAQPAYNCDDLQRKLELESLSKKEEIFRQTHCR